MTPDELGAYLRTGDDLYLWCRRGIVLTSFIAGFCMILVGIYQMGLIKHLPEPPLPRMDADRVDAAPEAYNRLWLPMPDAMLGLASYAITAALASMGGPDRHERLWWLPLLLLVKVAADAYQAGKLSWEQWALHQAFCFWCLVAAAVTFIAVPLALPETVMTVKRWTGGA